MSACWATQADRQRQADETDAVLYAEEIERRTEALMQTGQPCDPDSLANIDKATGALFGTPSGGEIYDYWYARAEARAVREYNAAVRAGTNEIY